MEKKSGGSFGFEVQVGVEVAGSNPGEPSDGSAAAAAMLGMTGRSADLDRLRAMEPDDFRLEPAKPKYFASWFGLKEPSGENDSDGKSMNLSLPVKVAAVAEAQKPPEKLEYVSIGSHSESGSSSSSSSLLAGWFGIRSRSKSKKLDGKAELGSPSSATSSVARKSKADHPTPRKHITKTKGKIDLSKAEKSSSSSSKSKDKKTQKEPEVATSLWERLFGPKGTEILIESSDSSVHGDTSRIGSTSSRPENMIIKVGGEGVLIELNQESSSSGPHKGELRLGYLIKLKKPKKAHHGVVEVGNEQIKAPKTGDADELNGKAEGKKAESETTATTKMDHIEGQLPPVEEVNTNKKTHKHKSHKSSSKSSSGK
ncbi:hypothetical protein Pelo_831 [Pelomyxa schiedti]|nr:hypothetical protein Pelo_831 [Pelomyxa schiedti]